MRWAVNRALIELPSEVSSALKKVLDELRSVLILARRGALNELPPVVRRPHEEGA